MPKKSALQRQRHEHCSAMRQLQLASRSKEDKADSDTNPSPQASVSAVSDLASTSTVAASRPSLPLLIPPPPSGASSSIFVNTTRFHSLFDNLVCGRCKRQVTVNVTDKWLDAECSVLCSCVTERTAAPSTVTHEGKALTKTNIALVLYSLTHNLGFRGFQVLSAVMERPAMHSVAYEKHAHFLYEAMDAHFLKKMEYVYRDVKKRCKQEEDDHTVFCLFFVSKS